MSKFGFDIVKANLEKTRTEVPLILANEAKNAFLKNFDDQGYDGNTWETPKRRIPGEPEYEYPKTKGLGRRTKNTLIGTGRGRIDVANSVEAGYAIPNGYVGVVKNEYMGFHNDGTIQDGGHLPQRQFVGFPETLTQHLRDKASEVIDKIWQI